MSETKNKTLQSKRAQLVEQRTEIEKAFQELEGKRAQLIANHNAVSGAIQVIDDLVKETFDERDPS